MSVPAIRPRKRPSQRFRVNLEDRFLRWRAHPALYVVEVFNVLPDPWQVQALSHFGFKPDTFEDYRAVYDEIYRKYHLGLLEKNLNWRTARTLNTCIDIAQRDWKAETLKGWYDNVFQAVSIRSAHGVGKSCVLNWCGHWMLDCFYPVKIGATAPTVHQIEDVLWSEVLQWNNRKPKCLKDRNDVTKLRLERKRKPESAFWTLKTSRKEQPESLQGLHQRHIAILADEASGVDDAVFEAAGGALTDENAHVAMGSNPIRLQGFFHASHHGARSSWFPIRVSAYDSPRVTQRYIDDIRRRYGEGSPAWYIRVLGEFPPYDVDSCVKLADVLDAVGRDVVIPERDPIIWGVDPARYGQDKSALCKRKRHAILEPIKTREKQDSRQIAGWVTAEYNETPEQSRPKQIVVDAIGIGAGIADGLRENLGNEMVKCLNMQEESPIDDKRFARLYDELYWTARDFFDAKDSTIPDDEEFVEEITRPRYKIRGDGKIVVETKEDIRNDKSRPAFMRKSPDKADAFILTFASGIITRKFKSGRRLSYRKRGHR